MNGRRGFIVYTGTAAVSVVVAPVLPRPARDTVNDWMEAEMLRHWREDPWRIIAALRTIGARVPHELIASAARLSGRQV
jgi:hypothetical protein